MVNRHDPLHELVAFKPLWPTAVAFFVSYWVDMYCLFRLWKQPPAMDGSLADAARVQISLVLLAHTFVTHHFFRGWPFDGYEPTGSYVGGVPLYEKTDLQSKYNVFDWSRGKWMSDEQARIVLIYAIVNIAAVSVFAVYYFGHSFKFGVHKLIWGSYVSVGDAREDEYSFVPGIQTYVPMVSHKSLGLPLIALVDGRSTFHLQQLHRAFHRLDFILAPRLRVTFTHRCFSHGVWPSYLLIAYRVVLPRERRHDLHRVGRSG